MKYPYVECGDHEPAPGYLVCQHVIEDPKKVAFYDPATEEKLGTIVCEWCEEHSDEAADKSYLTLACANAAKDIMERASVVH